MSLRTDYLDMAIEEQLTIAQDLSICVKIKNTIRFLVTGILRPEIFKQKVMKM